jgi:hypothetical protein
MTTIITWLLALWLAFALAACQPAAAIPPASYAPVSQSAFTPLPTEGGAPTDGYYPPPMTPSASPPPHPETVAPRPTSTPTPRPANPVKVSGHLAPPYEAARGLVTWQPISGYRASPGPLIRSWGVKQGEALRVCAGARCVTVTVYGWCACGDRHGQRTLLDLSESAFARLANPGKGVIEVEVER